MDKLKWIICDRCDGEGKIDNPVFSAGFTATEWHEKDLEEQAAYLGGEHDIPCTKCKGVRCVQVPNLAVMSFTEKRMMVMRRREARLDAQFLREFAAERESGC